MSAPDRRQLVRALLGLDEYDHPYAGAIFAAWQAAQADSVFHALEGLESPSFHSWRVHALPWRLTMARDKLVKRFAWAIPTREAIMALVGLGPLLEIGAGTGYWAYLVREAGGDIVPFDYRLRKANPFGHEVQWVKVYRGGTKIVGAAEYTGRTLFLCWPPYHTAMASECLAQYAGERLVYVGEGSGGCTADEAFHDALESGWARERMIDLPQWPGVNDGLYIWRRT